MTNGHTVWIIDSQHWPRACIRAELIERGLDAAGFEKLTEALRALHGPEHERPHVMILELGGLIIEPEDMDILAGCGIPVIILGGASELCHEAVKRHEWAATIKRPFSIGDVTDRVEKIINLQV